MHSYKPVHTADLLHVNGYGPDSEEFDGMVAELVASLWDTGQFRHEANDQHLIHCARLQLMQHCTTLTTQEIDAALARWLHSNNSFVTYD